MPRRMEIPAQRPPVPSPGEAAEVAAQVVVAQVASGVAVPAALAIMALATSRCPLLLQREPQFQR